MTSLTFFFVFTPILAMILLFISGILAPHNPYQEKDSAFECGFHSFLGQNRTQFSISFFIFALLFLLFDLEILLVYPYIVSAYSNGIYGLIVALIFFLVLTVGFAFELGKNALKIDSRQMYNLHIKNWDNNTLVYKGVQPVTMIVMTAGTVRAMIATIFLSTWLMTGATSNVTGSLVAEMVNQQNYNGADLQVLINLANEMQSVWPVLVDQYFIVVNQLIAVSSPNAICVETEPGVLINTETFRELLAERFQIEMSPLESHLEDYHEELSSVMDDFLAKLRSIEAIIARCGNTGYIPMPENPDWWNIDVVYPGRFPI